MRTSWRWRSDRGWPTPTPQSATSSTAWPKASPTWGSSSARPDTRTRRCAGHGQAIEIQHKLVDANPSVAEFRVQLAGSHINIANAQIQIGRPAEALRSLEEALALREKLDSPLPGDIYDRAALLAQISGLVGPGDKGIETGNRAMQLLHRAIAGGFRDPERMAKDTDLDSLRARPDFQLLMLDLAFPSHPFAREAGPTARFARPSPA